MDAGNTRIKVAHFTNGQIADIVRFTKEDKEGFKKFLLDHAHSDIFVSSVLSDKDLQFFLDQAKNVTYFSHKSQLPIQLQYKTPETLGLDRLANAVAIHKRIPNDNKVAIDMGTCIKFDFVDAQGNYHGGSISPGLTMRYEALHHFTGQLPLLKHNPQKELVGKSSTESIHSRVIFGIQGELNYFISSYLQQNQGLTFFVTGGDAKLFDFPLKNNIFADENLTLKGLYEIYLLNA